MEPRDGGEHLVLDSEGNTEDECTDYEYLDEIEKDG